MSKRRFIIFGCVAPATANAMHKIIKKEKEAEKRKATGKKGKGRTLQRTASSSTSSFSLAKNGFGCASNCRNPWIMIFDWSWVIAIQFIINAVATARLALTLPCPLSLSLSHTHTLPLFLSLSSPAQDIELWVLGVAKFPCIHVCVCVCMNRFDTFAKFIADYFYISFSICMPAPRPSFSSIFCSLHCNYF